MGQKQSKSLLDTVIDVKMASKDLERASRAAEKQEKAEKLRIKKAIEKGNKDGAQIYAQNAIRKKHEALNFLKLASKMDAVASRLETAEKTQTISNSIQQTIPQLSKALMDMSPEKMAMDMNQFEKIFEAGVGRSLLIFVIGLFC
jgi:charged multivesicular body protein 1